jgi:hypothetical protein
MYVQGGHKRFTNTLLKAIVDLGGLKEVKWLVNATTWFIGENRFKNRKGQVALKHTSMMETSDCHLMTRNTVYSNMLEK